MLASVNISTESRLVKYESNWIWTHQRFQSEELVVEELIQKWRQLQK